MLMVEMMDSVRYSHTFLHHEWIISVDPFPTLLFLFLALVISLLFPGRLFFVVVSIYVRTYDHSCPLYDLI